MGLCCKFVFFSYIYIILLYEYNIVRLGFERYVCKEMSFSVINCFLVEIRWVSGNEKLILIKREYELI